MLWASWKNRNPEFRRNFSESVVFIKSDWSCNHSQRLYEPRIYSKDHPRIAKVSRRSLMSKRWQTCTDSLLWICVSGVWVIVPSKLGSDEHVFKRFASFIWYYRRLSGSGFQRWLILNYTPFLHKYIFKVECPPLPTLLGVMSWQMVKFTREPFSFVLMPTICRWRWLQILFSLLNIFRISTCVESCFEIRERFLESLLFCIY